MIWYLQAPQAPPHHEPTARVAAAGCFPAAAPYRARAPQRCPRRPPPHPPGGRWWSGAVEALMRAMTALKAVPWPLGSSSRMPAGHRGAPYPRAGTGRARAAATPCALLPAGRTPARTLQHEVSVDHFMKQHHLEVAAGAQLQSGEQLASRVKRLEKRRGWKAAGMRDSLTRRQTTKHLEQGLAELDAAATAWAPLADAAAQRHAAAAPLH